MATRSIIAEVSGKGWNGRYCHWDGHPMTKVNQLLLLVARDGLETVKKTIIHDNYSWSSINPFAKREEDSQWKFVEGYGCAHNDLPPDQQYLFTESDTDFAWAEYLYVLGEKGLQVWEFEQDEDGLWSWRTSSDAYHPYLDNELLEMFRTMEQMRLSIS